MRRLALMMLVLGLCAAGVLLGLVSGPVLESVGHHAPRCAVASHVPGLRALARLGLDVPGEAFAAEKMRFRPLPAESADALERRKASAAEPAAPAAPEPPSAPATPEPPQVVKSGDIMRVGSDIHVGRDEVVRGSVSAIGGDVTVDGHVEGDVSAIRGDVYLGSTARVDGDVVSAGGQIHEEPGAFVGGQRVTAMAGGRIHGLRRQVEREHAEGASHVVSALLWFLVLVGLGWAVAQLAPGRTAAAVTTLQRAPALSFGLGALVLALAAPSMIALALLVAFLCITIIGIPLAFAALLGYALFFMVFGAWGFIVGAGGLGAAIAGRQDGAAAGATAAGAMTPAGIRRAVLVGTAVLAGSLVLATLLGLPRMLGPLRGLGIALCVITVITMCLTTLAGGGAWLRSEFQTGMLGRWWQRRRVAGVGTVPPVPPPVASPPPAPSPPSAFEPPAPAPPSAFAPPPPPPPSPFAPPGPDPGTSPPASG